jgi:biotin-dependent carboxylase-like uncharacterized protein
MDPRAHRVANALVGNDPDQATLEVTLIGPEIQFEDQRIVAVAGAAFALTVDGESTPLHSPFVVKAGSRLRFGSRSEGSRAYVAVGGGFQVPKALGSRATHLMSAMGGFQGRALAAGDRVPLGEPLRNRRALDPPLRVNPELTRLPGHPARLRVLRGPEHDRFAHDALDVLQSGSYTIARDSDRMGFRLQGAALRHRLGPDIISGATPLGALQVPGSEQPVLLMADRQTTGGYAKIATVISADIHIAGQLGPGDAVSFAICSRADAVAALIAHERVLMAIEDRTARGGR